MSAAPLLARVVRDCSSAAAHIGRSGEGARRSGEDALPRSHACARGGHDFSFPMRTRIEEKKNKPVPIITSGRWVNIWSKSS